MITKTFHLFKVINNLILPNSNQLILANKTNKIAFADQKEKRMEIALQTKV